MTREQAMVVHPSPQDRRVDEARERLQLARQHTRGTLKSIRKEIVAKTDLTSRVRESPALFMALAFFAGFLLAHRR